MTQLHCFADKASRRRENSTGQYWWVEGIRYPGEEFESHAAEQVDYKLVREANEQKRGRAWVAEDYQEFHTVAAFRSSLDPAQR